MISRLAEECKNGPLVPHVHIPDPSRPRSFSYVRPRVYVVLWYCGCGTYSSGCGSPLLRRPTVQRAGMVMCVGAGMGQSQSNTISDKTDTVLRTSTSTYVSLPPRLAPLVQHDRQRRERGSGSGSKSKSNPFHRGIPTPSRAPRSTPALFPTSLDPQPCPCQTTLPKHLPSNLLLS